MNNPAPSASSGFIALISAIVISLVLIALAFTLSSSGYFLRFGQLTAEYKAVSLALAESCENSALLNIAQNFNYAGNQAVAVGAQSCFINSINYSAESSGQKIADIGATANYHGAFSSVEVKAQVQDPAVTPQALPQPANIAIISWQENP